MLAQKLGISIYILSQIELDEIDLYYSTLVKISELLNVPLSVLFAVEEKNYKVEESEEEKLLSQIKAYQDYARQLQNKYDELKERLSK